MKSVFMVKEFIFLIEVLQNWKYAKINSLIILHIFSK